jgi:hypothetical protein
MGEKVHVGVRWQGGKNEVRSAQVGDSSIKRQTMIVKELSKATVLPRWPDDV